MAEAHPPLLLELGWKVAHWSARAEAERKGQRHEAASMAHLQANIWRSALALAADHLGYHADAVLMLVGKDGLS